MAPLFRRGDMVWSYFPFAETLDIPARTRHAAIIIGAFSATEASRMLGHPVPAYGAAVAVYTSSQVKKFGGNLPIGIIQVPLDRARQNKNNSAFFIDTRVRAYLPIHKDYFPDLDAPNHGLITSIDPGLFRRVMEEFARVVRSAQSSTCIFNDLERVSSLGFGGHDSAAGISYPIEALLREMRKRDD